MPERLKDALTTHEISRRVKALERGVILNYCIAVILSVVIAVCIIEVTPDIASIRAMGYGYCGSVAVAH